MDFWKNLSGLTGSRSAELLADDGYAVHDHDAARGGTVLVALLAGCEDYGQQGGLGGVVGIKGEGGDDGFAALVAGELGAVECDLYGCAVEVDADREAYGVAKESSVDSDVLLSDDVECQGLLTGQGVVVLRNVRACNLAAVNFDGAQLHAHEREVLECKADGLVVNFGDGDVPGDVRTDRRASQSDIEQALVLACQLFVYGVCDVGIVSSAGDCFREIGSCCYTVLCRYSECHCAL